MRDIKERGGATGGTCDGCSFKLLGCSGTGERLPVCGEIGGESVMYGLLNGCEGA